MSMNYGTLTRLGGSIISQKPGEVVVEIPDRAAVRGPYNGRDMLEAVVAYFSRQLAADDPHRQITVHHRYNEFTCATRLTFTGGLNVVVYP